MYILRKCPAPKTGLRPVSIQVQLVSYQCQHGHKLVNYQCQSTGHELVSNQCHNRTRSRQRSFVKTRNKFEKRLHDCNSWYTLLWKSSM